MLNPNDAAYILQQIYPTYLAFHQLDQRKQLAVGGMASYFEKELRMGFGQKLLRKGSLFYALFGAVNAARNLLGGKDSTPEKRRALVKEAALSFERAWSFLRGKGRMDQLMQLEAIVAGKEDTKELKHHLAAFLSECKLYGRDLQTLVDATQLGLQLTRERFEKGHLLQKEEDLNDLKSLLALLGAQVASIHQESILSRTYQALDCFLIRYHLRDEKPIAAVPGDVLTELCSILARSYHEQFLLPGTVKSPDVRWGLSESSFLALCTEASECRDLRHLVIRGRTLKNPLPATATGALGDIIRHNPRLLEIDLRDNGIEGHGWRPLATALAEVPELDRLNMDGNPLGEPGADALASGLRAAPALTSLHVSRCAIDDNGANTLAENLATVPYLRSIDLSHNPISDAGCIGIARLILSGTLQELVLDHCPIGDQGAITLSSALKRGCSLRVLKLRSCDISNQGSEALKRAQKDVGPKLKLDLGGNRVEESPEKTLNQITNLQHHLFRSITDQGQKEECNRLLKAIMAFAHYDTQGGARIRLHLIEVLGQGLAELELRQSSGVEITSETIDPLMERLYDVYLSYHPDPLVREIAEGEHGLIPAKEVTRLVNELLERHEILLGDQGAKMLQTLLSVQKLQSLTLIDQNIGPKGADALGNGLARSDSLIALHIEDCPLGDQGVINIGLGLLTNQSVRQLKLIEVGAGAKGLLNLARSIAGNGALRKLTLAQEGLKDEDSAALLQGLQQDRGLTALCLEKLQIGPRSMHLLASILERHPRLQSLRIAHTQLSEEAVRALAEGIGKNKTLEELELCSCQIEDAGVEALQKVLKLHPRIRSLDLSDNQLSEDAKALFLWRSDMEYFKKL
ncbi:MAG: hypothetical protein KDK78_01195 [Chlamydiia bacterium]|nr:hypothetical protein [Chlamydiia bacterium]